MVLSLVQNLQRRYRILSLIKREKQVKLSRLPETSYLPKKNLPPNKMKALTQTVLYSQTIRANLQAVCDALKMLEDAEAPAKHNIEEAATTLVHVLLDVSILGSEALHTEANVQVDRRLEGLLDKLEDPEDLEQEVRHGDSLSILCVDALDQAARQSESRNIPIDQEDDED